MKETFSEISDALGKKKKGTTKSITAQLILLQKKKKTIQRCPGSRTTLLSCSKSNLAIGLCLLLFSMTNGGTGYLRQHTAEFSKSAFIISPLPKEGSLYNCLYPFVYLATSLPVFHGNFNQVLTEW